MLNFLDDFLLKKGYHIVKGVGNTKDSYDKEKTTNALTSLDYVQSALEKLTKKQQGEIIDFILVPHELVPEVDIEGDYIIYTSSNGKEETENSK
jgi:hypothetical protein